MHDTELKDFKTKKNANENEVGARASTRSSDWSATARDGSGVAYEEERKRVPGNEAIVTTRGVGNARSGWVWNEPLRKKICPWE